MFSSFWACVLNVSSNTPSPSRKTKWSAIAPLGINGRLQLWLD